MLTAQPYSTTNRIAPSPFFFPIYHTLYYFFYAPLSLRILLYPSTDSVQGTSYTLSYTQSL